AHAARLLVAVEGERVGLELRTPEAGVEPLGEILGRGLEPARPLALAEALGAARRQELAAVDIALHLGERDRPLREPAVGMEARVQGILPALVGEALLGGAVVFDEAVAVGIARSVDPG